MELRPSDHLLLKHVGLYHLSIRAALARVIFVGGTDPGNALAALVKAGYLKDKLADKPLRIGGGRRGQQGIPYYLLGSEALKLYRFPKERGTAPSTAALRRNLAALWFCCLQPQRRYRLEAAELRELFGEGAPHHNIPHCVANDAEGPVVYRIYATTTDVKHTLKQARLHLEETSKNRTLREWIASGDYGFAILAELPEKCEDLRDALCRRQGNLPPLELQARFVVGLGPSPPTLALALKDLQSSSKEKLV